MWLPTCSTKQNVVLLVSFAAAPKDEIGRTQLLADLESFLHLSCRVCDNVRVRIGCRPVGITVINNDVVIKKKKERKIRFWGNRPTNRGWAKRLQVFHNSLTPVFSCNSRTKSDISSRFRLVSSNVPPSGDMSRSWNVQYFTPIIGGHNGDIAVVVEIWSQLAVHIASNLI